MYTAQSGHEQVASLKPSRAWSVNERISETEYRTRKSFFSGTHDMSCTSLIVPLPPVEFVGLRNLRP